MSEMQMPQKGYKKNTKKLKLHDNIHKQIDALKSRQGRVTQLFFNAESTRFQKICIESASESVYLHGGNRVQSHIKHSRVTPA